MFDGALCASSPRALMSRSQLKLKCHAIFLDTTLSDRTTVLTTYYESMLIAGLKWRVALNWLVRVGGFATQNRRYLQRSCAEREGETDSGNPIAAG